jgi:hypothetical protein
VISFNRAGNAPRVCRLRVVTQQRTIWTHRCSRSRLFFTAVGPPVAVAASNCVRHRPITSHIAFCSNVLTKQTTCLHSDPPGIHSWIRRHLGRRSVFVSHCASVRGNPRLTVAQPRMGVRRARISVLPLKTTWFHSLPTRTRHNWCPSQPCDSGLSMCVCLLILATSTA